MRPAVIAFDLDGVIVDTVGELYQTYLRFLRDRGRAGSPEEFERLNGPSLPEIVGYLRDTHGLSASPEELLVDYLAEVDLAYERAGLIDGARELLERLHPLGTPLALATSAPRAKVVPLLERFSLDPLFELVVTGDDVERSKPDPAIYQLVRDSFPGADLWVVEDSERGVIAARGAGGFPLKIDPSAETATEAVRTLGSLREAAPYLEAICRSCRLEPIDQDPEVRIVGDLKPDSESLALIEQSWSQAREERPDLHDGPVVAYRGHGSDPGQLTIDALKTSYKTLHAQRRDPRIRLGVEALGVSGVVVDPRGRILAGVRQQVASYRDHLELVPSGGIRLANVRGDEVLVVDQLLEELSEEAGIERSSVREILPLCLIQDRADQVWDLCFLIRVESLTSVAGRPEYRELRPMSLASLESASDPVVPVSAVLLAWLRWRRDLIPPGGADE